MKPVELNYVTLEYGAVRDYWISPTHTGRDYRAPTGTNVHACAPGTVLHEGYGGLGSSYGNHVLVQHKTPGGKTVKVIYAHLSSNNVKDGQFVRTGEKIGDAGGTGNVTAPHLHLEQRHPPYGYWDNEFPTVIYVGAPRGGKKYPNRLIWWVNTGYRRRVAIRKIQKALNREYPRRKIRVTGRWDMPTKALYKHHQHVIGLTGNDADGEPGPISIKRLDVDIVR